MSLGLSPAQLNSAAYADARVNLWTGAIRSGKTIASLLPWLRFISTASYDGALVMVGRTRDSLARNVLEPLTQPQLWGDLAQYVRYNPGAPSATILGRRIHILGASDTRSEMTLRGLTVAGAYVDEATLVSEAFWTQLTGRMSVPGAQLFATTNPDGPAHWLKRQVVDRAEELKYRVFHFELTDNQWLLDHNPAYVAQVQREYTGLWHRRFILGEWVQAEGAIFADWSPERHVVRTAPRMDRIIAIGVDHGTTNPTRGHLVGLADGALWVLDEWAPSTGLTDAEQSEKFGVWQRELATLYGPAPWIFVDPAAASFKAQLFHDGHTNVTGAHHDVGAGIRTVASLLATDRLKVLSRCEHLIRQIPGYVWDPKATAEGHDRPIKRDDHEVDALRYAVHSSRALWRAYVPSAAADRSAPGADEPEGLL